MLILLNDLSGTTPNADRTSTGFLLLLTRTIEAIVSEGVSPEARYITGQAYKPQLIGQAKFPGERIA